MTTIAWDGRAMSADRQMTDRNTALQVVRSKLRRITYEGKPALAAGAGTSVYIAAVIDWLAKGQPADSKPEMPTTPDSFTVIVATEAGLFEYIDSLRPLALGQIKWAIGTGSEFALGAMDAGASAKRAVQIACVRDINSGLGIDTITLRRK